MKRSEKKKSNRPETAKTTKKTHLRIGWSCAAAGILAAFVAVTVLVRADWLNPASVDAADTSGSGSAEAISSEPVSSTPDSSEPGASAPVSTVNSAGSSSAAAPSAIPVQAAPAENPASETVTFTTAKGFRGVTENGVTYIDGYLVVNKTYSLPASYGNGLTAEMKAAFNEMAAAAKREGLNVYIRSGFRSYETQRKVYNSYVRQDGAAVADTYSARPGHSEHQTGLAVDVNTIDSSFLLQPECEWLDRNCYRFGFILRYPDGKTDETGYIYEPWHFRYVGKELAAKLYNGGDWLTIENYFGLL